MNAIVIEEEGNLDSLSVKEIQIPKIQKGYVLIRTEYASINVAYEAVALGKFYRKSAHKTIGSEGCGTVINSGGGPLADSLLNKRVCFLCTGAESTGSFSDYCIADAKLVLPLDDSTAFELSANIFLNIFMVMYFIRIVRRGNHRAVVLDAAASSISKNMIKYCKHLGIPTISIVRSAKQVEILNNLGAENVICSAEGGWKERAIELASHYGATIAFDAISGEKTGEMVEIIGESGYVYVYGSLSGDKCVIDPSLIISKKKYVCGLNIVKWLFKIAPLKKYKILKQAESLMANQILTSDYYATINMNEVKEAFIKYHNQKTNTKFLIKTNQ